MMYTTGTPAAKAKRVIYKYELSLEDRQSVEMPEGAVILSAGNQNEKLVIWAMLPDFEAKTEPVQITIFGTGHKMPNDYDGDYINTVIMMNGQLVWHIFKDFDKDK